MLKRKLISFLKVLNFSISLIVSFKMSRLSLSKNDWILLVSIFILFGIIFESLLLIIFLILTAKSKQMLSAAI